jgi:hypothetical protein
MSQWETPKKMKPVIEQMETAHTSALSAINTLRAGADMSTTTTLNDISAQIGVAAVQVAYLREKALGKK